MIKKIENKSKLYLFFSLIIFSVGVPIIDGKINYWENQKEIFGRNLLTSEFQRVMAAWAIDAHQTLDVVQNLPFAKNPPTDFLLHQLQEYYLKQAQLRTANVYFLSTESVNNDNKPDQERYEEIKNEILKNSPEIKKEAEDFINDFNQDYQKGLFFWQIFKYFAYILAILLQLIGLFSAEKNTETDKLVKDVRTLTQRVNVLIKQKNKQS